MTVVDLKDVVRGEFAENAMRQDFLPSEVDSIRRALEPFEKPAADKGNGQASDGVKATFLRHDGQSRIKSEPLRGSQEGRVEKIAAVCGGGGKAPPALWQARGGDGPKWQG